MNLPFHRHVLTFQISLRKSYIIFRQSLHDPIWFAGFTPKSPPRQCQYCEVPRYLDVNTHEAPMGESNRIPHHAVRLFGNFAMARVSIALLCEKVIGQPKLNHGKRNVVSLEVHGFLGIPYCNSPWTSRYRNRHLMSLLKRWVTHSTNMASLGIHALSHLHWHNYYLVCVCVCFCDCQSQYKNGFCIDSYDRKVSVKWAALLLAVSSF